MRKFSIIIKDGLVFDGTRAPRIRTDIGIRDGIITAIGKLDEADADRVIDAEGLHVAPGFIDIHTHYDAQVFWDPYCSMSGWHGVTTVSTGNCGFALAPVPVAGRDYAMSSLSRTEAIPVESMKVGLPWDWETIPEYLDSVDRTPKAMNIVPLVGIGPLTIQVMGLERAKAGVLPTDAEHAEMRRLLNEAMDAGANGWSIQHMGDSIYNVQRDSDGTPMVTDVMHDETWLQLAQVLGERNEGIMQVIFLTGDFEGDRKRAERVAELSRRPVIWNAVLVHAANPQKHRGDIAWLKSCQERGLTVYGQGVTTNAETYFTLEDFSFWDTEPNWRDVLQGTNEERLAKLAERRDILRANPPRHFGRTRMDHTFLQKTLTKKYERFEGMSFAQIGRELGVNEIDALIDIVLADGLATTLRSQTSSGAHVNSYWREMSEPPYMLIGSSDGGAHTKFITNGRYTTEYLIRFVRERDWVSLEEAHWRLSAFPAQLFGIKGRGVLEVGAAADIVIYDYANLEILPCEVVKDLPANEWRRVQRARGYKYVLVNGQVTIKDDEELGVHSGRLLRWGGDARRQPLPKRLAAE
jgi:N-acyl-D-amino-acid deacylase